MFRCSPIDVMRRAYEYLGEWTPPGELHPRPGAIRYYFICQNWAPVFNVDYASHFYDQPSHKIGHLVKPPGYATTNGAPPFPPEVCGCCFDETPVLPLCGCAVIVCGLLIEVTDSPWGAYEIAINGTWDKIHHEYLNFNDFAPPDSGYFVEAVSYDSPSNTWIVHFSTPTDFVALSLTQDISAPCRWSVLSAGELPPDVTLGQVSLAPSP